MASSAPTTTQANTTTPGAAQLSTLPVEIKIMVFQFVGFRELLSTFRFSRSTCDVAKEVLKDYIMIRASKIHKLPFPDVHRDFRDRIQNIKWLEITEDRTDGQDDSQWNSNPQIIDTIQSRLINFMPQLQDFHLTTLDSYIELRFSSPDMSNISICGGSPYTEVALMVSNSRLKSLKLACEIADVRPSGAFMELKSFELFKFDIFNRTNECRIGKLGRVFPFNKLQCATLQGFSRGPCDSVFLRLLRSRKSLERLTTIAPNTKMLGTVDDAASNDLIGLDGFMKLQAMTVVLPYEIPIAVFDLESHFANLYSQSIKSFEVVVSPSCPVQCNEIFEALQRLVTRWIQNGNMPALEVIRMKMDQEYLQNHHNGVDFETCRERTITVQASHVQRSPAHLDQLSLHDSA